LTVVHFIQSKSIISDEQLIHYTHPKNLIQITTAFLTQFGKILQVNSKARSSCTSCKLEFCTHRTSSTNLRVFRINRYLFLVFSSYFRHRLFVIIVRTVSVFFHFAFNCRCFLFRVQSTIVHFSFCWRPFRLYGVWNFL